jgi:signal transduction histidine kinase
MPDLVSHLVSTVLIVVWLAAALVTMRRRDVGWLPHACGCVAALVAVITFVDVSDASSSTGSGPGSGVRPGTGSAGTERWLEGLAIGLLPALLCVIGIGLPNGAFVTAARRNLAVLAGIGGLAVGAVVAEQMPPLPTGVVAAECVVLALVAAAAAIARSRSATPVDRNRLQWVGWGVAVAALAAAVGWVLHQLVEQPTEPGAVAVGFSAIVPIALAVATVERAGRHIESLLVHTVIAGGLLLTACAVYLVVVLGFTDSPTPEQRRVLALALVAAALTALLFGPVRARLAAVANRRVYGTQRSPEEALQTFGSRMSRAIPLDELMLQLAESLKKSLRLTAAEVWTATDGVLELAASVPHRRPPRIQLTAEELPVVTTSHVSGNGWAQIWLRQVVDDHPGKVLRVVPMAHSGELVGLLVCTRLPTDSSFNEEEDRVLGELARQVGLALHNSRLDSALTASLDDLRNVNSELAASRARVVTAADESRRRIERNLHDGAQQHLVALAVKVGLVKKLMTMDPATAAELLDELRGDVQTTLTELRELAHGIYPPLLRDRGLPEALQAAANRAVHPTNVEASVSRHSPDLEAAVYFCCLEAIQNAGKYAGPDATIDVCVEEVDGEVVFTVRDTGQGFDSSADVTQLGHGFVNMADRVGAIGGRLEVTSALGKGTTITGRIPVATPVPVAPVPSPVVGAPTGALGAGSAVTASAQPDDRVPTSAR